MSARTRIGVSAFLVAFGLVVGPFSRPRGSRNGRESECSDEVLASRLATKRFVPHACTHRESESPGLAQPTNASLPRSDRRPYTE